MAISEQLEKSKIITVIRGVESEKLLPLCTALYNGGIKFVEIAFPQDGNDIKTSEDIKLLVDNFKDKMHIGAGTVLNKKQVRLTKKAGGEFIISPNTCKKIIRYTKKQNLMSIAGAFTPTEIVKATKCGADFIKLFPASEISPSYIKAIKYPLTKTKLLAVGGITLENIKEYSKVGVCGFGISSGIVNKELLKQGDYNGITNLAKEYVSKLQ